MCEWGDLLYWQILPYIWSIGRNWAVKHTNHLTKTCFFSPQEASRQQGGEKAVIGSAASWSYFSIHKQGTKWHQSKSPVRLLRGESNPWQSKDFLWISLAFESRTPHKINSALLRNKPQQQQTQTPCFGHKHTKGLAKGETHAYKVQLKETSCNPVMWCTHIIRPPKTCLAGKTTAKKKSAFFQLGI